MSTPITFKDHPMELVKGKDMEAWRRQILKEYKNLFIANKETEHNVCHLQLSKGELALERVFMLRELV